MGIQRFERASFPSRTDGSVVRVSVRQLYESDKDERIAKESEGRVAKRSTNPVAKRAAKRRCNRCTTPVVIAVRFAVLIR